MLRPRWILLTIAALLVAPALLADSITIDGAVFSLTSSQVTGNTYLFDYKINTTAYTGPGDVLRSVAVNPSGAQILSGSFTGPAGWTSARQPARPRRMRRTRRQLLVRPSWFCPGAACGSRRHL